jgi:hypothetical protein
MKLPPILILFAALPALASCVAPSPSVDHCAGWEIITLSGEAVEFLAARDPQALEAIIAHAEFGRERKCWK